jgi:hypothetical protein
VTEDPDILVSSNRHSLSSTFLDYFSLSSESKRKRY